MTGNGKIVMITGSSAGIGQACAEVFAEAGFKLILIARRYSRIVELSKSLAEKFGTESITFQCDIRNNEEIIKTIASLSEEWQNIDILINNAGLARGIEKIQDGVLGNWEEMIDTNVKGLLYISRAVLPVMVRRSSGTIVNIASIAGREMYPGGNVYCATKAAVRAISKCMSLDLNGTNIRTVNIDPGLVDTEFAPVRYHWDTEKAKKVYEGIKPLTGRDIAEIALFCVLRPLHVTIQDILVTPTAQASTTLIHREI